LLFRRFEDDSLQTQVTVATSKTVEDKTCSNNINPRRILL